MNKKYCDMDFEQKYKDVIKMAREAYYSSETPHVAKAWLLTMFPTIAENEDERIRKELIEQVAYIIPNDDEVDSEGDALPAYQKRIDKYRAWLEKQGHMLDPDKVIAWLKTNVYDDSAYGMAMIEKFKKAML